jgi:hypothetical protein
MILLESYFIAHYFVSDSMEQALTILIQEMNSTCRAGPYLTFANNVMRQMFIDEKFKVEETNSLNVSSYFVRELYNINTDMQKDHSLNILYHNSLYNNFFELVMKVGACSEVIKLTTVTLDDCKNFAKGIVDESLALAMSRHFENIRYLLTLYDSISKDPTTVFPGTINNYG